MEHGPARASSDASSRVTTTRTEIRELRALLDESELVRAGLVAKTAELEQRLAALEKTVAGMTGKLIERRVGASSSTRSTGVRLSRRLPECELPPAQAFGTTPA